MYSLPYSSINMWSSENAGSILDFTGELELCTRAGKIKISVGKQVDVRRLDILIAMCVLGELDQPETNPAPPSHATHTASMPKAPCGRASISGGVGHVH